MKLGAQNNPRLDLLDEIKWVQQNELDLIDIVFDAPHAALETTKWKGVRHALDDTKLDVICRAPTYLPLNNPSPLVRQAALDELRRAVDAAKILGAQICTIPFCGWPDYFSEKDGYAFTQQMLSILIKHGADRNVRIALENSPRNQHQLKYFREIFHRQPDLHLSYDIGNGNVQTAAPSTTRDYLFALTGHLAHVRISDNDGTTGSHLPIGAPASGAIDLLRELRTLRSFQYDGSITVDVAGDRRWLLGSVTLIREMWATAG